MSEPPANSNLRTLILSILSPFIATATKINPYRILGKPILVSNNGESQPSYLFLYADNFALGSCWGVFTGYSSDAFFKPAPLRFQSMLKSNVLLVSILSGRVLRRMGLAGLLFDAVERKAAQNLGHATRSSTTSTLAGLTTLACVFRVSKGIKESFFITSFLLGGYAIGSHIAFLIRSSLSGRDSRKPPKPPND